MRLFTEAIYIFRSILPELLMPPAGLLWVVLAGLLIRLVRRRAGAIIAGIGLAGLFLLSLPAVGGALIASLERGESPADGPLRADTPLPGAIVILGADGDRTREPPARAAPGPLSLQRLAAAATIARKTNLPVLISGGEVGANEPAVADLMASQFDDAFGLQAMWREIKSRNTCENARFSAAILRRAGIPAAYVVTHAWHMPRAILSFERAGYPVIPAPVHADAVEIRGIADFLPHTSAWMRSFFAIHEWIGLVAYRLGACPRSDPQSAP
jgi:uncharacterized SAM-binding protein YcdF (DUF218 family)